MIESIIEFVRVQLLTNEFFSGAALATILGSVLYQLKAFPKLVWERVLRLLVYHATVYQNSEVFVALEARLAECYAAKYRNVEALLDRESGDVADTDSPVKVNQGHEDKTGSAVVFTHHTDTFIVWYRGWPLRIVKGREKLENASSTRNAFLVSFGVSTFAGRKLVESFINEAWVSYAARQRKKKNTLRVFASQYSDWSLVHEQSRNFESVILARGIKEQILADLRHFQAQRSVYTRLGIPYKRAYLLHGPPGNGKTSFTLALAAHLKMDVYYLNLASVPNDNDLQRLFRSIGKRSVLVLEDIDALFGGRELGGDEADHVTFSGLLNCLDGVFYKDELITVITTNHYGRLDPAMTRKGRVDLTIEVANPVQEQVETYLSIFYGEPVQLSMYHDDRAMADVVDACLTLSMSECVEFLQTPKSCEEVHCG